MLHDLETYPLINHLKKELEIFTAGVIVSIVNLELLPQPLLVYLNATDEQRAVYDADQLKDLLGEVLIWIIREKTEKPNEYGALEPNLETPPQETRKRNEYLTETLAATLIEECLPIDTENKSNNQTQIVYCPGASYLGHSRLSSPKVKPNQYRADYFLIGLSRPKYNSPLHDPDVTPVGWIPIEEYLNDYYLHRRQGGKEVTVLALTQLLTFLETYWENQEAYQYNIHDLAILTKNRQSKEDFRKQKVVQAAAVAAESSPAS